VNVQKGSGLAFEQPATPGPSQRSNARPDPSVEARTDRLVSQVEERELDCLLVTNLLNVRYLTGFTGTNGACIVTPDERLFLTDFRYVEQAAEQVQGYEPHEIGRDMLGGLAERLRGRAGFDDDHMSVSAHAKLGEKLPEGVELVPAGGLVEDLRAVKDESEVAAMRAAAEIADEAYGWLRETGLAGRTEREVAIALSRFMEDHGAEAPSFPPIVASGAHGALPHAVPRDAEIPSGTLVVIDMGARVDGYCSDCTRTLATGPLDDAAREIYELVLSAQETALAAVRAGASCPAVDAVARDLIEAAGQGERFGHGLGHGVGLEVHEAPRLGKTAEGELESGNAVTVEPGVYVPGEVGVRIEDLVIVTDGEPDVLTGFPKELVTIV
jgi:Xaa-Pro aminopeptidase